ncbi:thiamine-phosphate kinase [Alkalihalobacterium bogoriense]|uniref:thiamine-phosphate kinase n=1 Tax=Alkalihalobacterium bogoriense TaxID=246272 RepID=UPI00047968E2|nr:thiamine-phosphate kinase [Alkalihalobacterium bogoriense]
MKDEFEFIKRITPAKKNQQSITVGIGDDAAVYEAKQGFEQVVCVDTMVEGIHFRKDTLLPKHIGYKALAINISDLAAMGAVPLYYLVSIAIPPHWSDNEIDDIYRGMTQLAENYKMDLLGGDTVSTDDKLVISVTALGHVEKGSALLRSHAKPDDIVFVTGVVGHSAAGLDLLFKHGVHAKFTPNEKVLVGKHQMPMPQIEAGRCFISSQLRMALNDISDGVASEAHEIAEASEVTLLIEADKIPTGMELECYSREKQLEYALFGGEDFQLIGTVQQKEWQRLNDTCEKHGIILTAIGYVEEGEAGVFLMDNGKKRKVDKKGYNHFKK